VQSEASAEFKTHVQISIEIIVRIIFEQDWKLSQQTTDRVGLSTDGVVTVGMGRHLVDMTYQFLTKAVDTRVQLRLRMER
jgi:hypothetical protein